MDQVSSKDARSTPPAQYPKSSSSGANRTIADQSEASSNTLSNSTPSKSKPVRSISAASFVSKESHTSKNVNLPFALDGAKENYIPFKVNPRAEITIRNVTDKPLLVKYLLTFSDSYDIIPSIDCIAPGTLKKILFLQKKDLVHERSKINNRFQIRYFSWDQEASQIPTDSAQLDKIFRMRDESQVKKITLQTVFVCSDEFALENQKYLELKDECLTLKHALDKKSLEIEKLSKQAETVQSKVREELQGETNRKRSSSNNSAGGLNRYENSKEFDLGSIIRATLNREQGPKTDIGYKLLLFFVIGLLMGLLV